MIEPFPLIEISGPPFSRGVEYGQKAVERIRKGTTHYLSQLDDLSLDAAGVAALVRDYLPVIEQFEPAYVEEMRGIAKGADVPFEDVVLLNARTEILKLARPEVRARLAWRSPRISSADQSRSAPRGLAGHVLTIAERPGERRPGVPSRRAAVAVP